MSGLSGQPPLNQGDIHIIKGFMHLLNVPPAAVNISKGVPLGPARPANYVYETKAPHLLAGYSIAIFFVVSITLTRLGLRAFHSRLQWGWDDWLIIPGRYIFATAWLVMVLVMVRTAGAGQHMWDSTYRQISNFFMYGQIGQLMFYMAISFTKMSIILFNRRLTGLASRAWSITHHIMLGVIVMFMCISAALCLATCTPLVASFGLENRGKFPNVKCLNSYHLGLGESLVHILTDIALLAVPITVIVRVSMNVTMKIRLILLFSVCLLSCFGSIMRLAIVLKRNPDFTWTYYRASQWTALDITTAVIVASLPMLNPVLDYLLPTKWCASTFRPGDSWVLSISNDATSPSASKFGQPWHIDDATLTHYRSTGPCVSIRGGHTGSSINEELSSAKSPSELDQGWQPPEKSGGVQVRHSFSVTSPRTPDERQQAQQQQPGSSYGYKNVGQGYPHSHPQA